MTAKTPQDALTPVVKEPPKPWTKDDQAEASRAYKSRRDRLARLLQAPRRTGLPYWQWVLEQVAGGRRLPQDTIDTARMMVDRLNTPAAAREPGQDDEELELTRVPLPDEKESR